MKMTCTKHKMLVPAVQQKPVHWPSGQHLWPKPVTKQPEADRSERDHICPFYFTLATSAKLAYLTISLPITLETSTSTDKSLPLFCLSKTAVLPQI